MPHSRCGFTAIVAEVWAFLFGFGMPMAQLDPTTRIIGNAHHAHTFDKPPLAGQRPIRRFSML